MFETDVVPGPPHADVKRAVLDQWLGNPFLDEDSQSLSLRLGISHEEVKKALESLCKSRFLINSTSFGYRLLLDLEAPEEQRDETVLDEGEARNRSLSQEVPEALTRGDGVISPLGIPSGIAAILSGTDTALNQLVEAMPFGVVVLQENGCLELANEKALCWLDVPIDLLDGATFEIATGVNPLPVAAGARPVRFSLPTPHPVEVTMHRCQLQSGPGVLIALTDLSLQEEVSRMQAEVQEEFFNRLRQEMVSPLLIIERFLDNPDAAVLGQARTAMEQINWFLRTYLFRAAPDKP